MFCGAYQRLPLRPKKIPPANIAQHPKRERAVESYEREKYYQNKTL